MKGKIFKHGTAEELSSDEHVRRLYLGRNFELKRKDYLLDQGKNNGRPTVNNLIQSIEKVLSMYEKMTQAEKESSFSLGVENLESAEEIGVYDYAKTLSELQDTLRLYAKESQNEELLEKTNALFQQKESIASDLDQMLQLLKDKKYQ